MNSIHQITAFVAPAASQSRVVSSPWLALPLLTGLAFPFLVRDYVLFQACMVFSYAVALLGLNILTGYNGQISLGHGAFFAIGAYAAAILMDTTGMPYWLAIPAAGMACLIVGYLFGLPALKLEGLYLALVTFSLGVAMPQLLKYKHLEKWTGGVQGIVLSAPEAPFGLPLNPSQWLYFVSFAVMAVLFLVARNLLRSGVGRAITAIRDQPLAAEAMGVNSRHYKASVFGISAMYTGIGGALSAISVQYVAPDSFTMFLSISLLVGVVVGGIATLSGAFYGAVFIMFVPSAAEKISKSAPWAAYGVVLILLVFVMPSGVAGLIGKIKERYRKRNAVQASSNHHINQ
jgi:branched-chain amino acid transport system permease protein